MSRRGARPRRREQATGELRRAIAGREHEFIGLILIVAAVILRRRHLLRLRRHPRRRHRVARRRPCRASAATSCRSLLLIVGVSFIRSARSSSPYRLVIGWSLVGLTTLGILHVASGPEGFSVSGVTDSGGVIGWIVGEPLRTLMAEFGSIVLLVALGIGGLLLITQASLRTIARGPGMRPAHRSRRGVDRPAGRSCSPQRPRQPVVAEQRQRCPPRRRRGLSADRPTSTRPARRSPWPCLQRPYDAADDFGSDDGTGAPRRRRRTTSNEPFDGDAAAGDGPGNWVLPSVSLLHRGATRSVDQGEAAGRGRILEQSLEQHGVDTTLAGMTVGPTVTRYELELGPGVEGRPGDVAATRHRLRDGGHRRAHPRPDPGQVGDRCRGPQPHPTARLPRRPAPRPGGSCGDRPARRRHRQGHRRRRRVPRPRHDPARAHRRGDGRGQVELHQQHPRLAADAPDPRPGAPDPRRPEAGRDGSVQPPAAPAHAAGDEPEEGGQRPRLGRQGDGAALRPAVGEGVTATSPATTRRSTRANSRPTRGARRSRSGCPTSSSWSTSSTT